MNRSWCRSCFFFQLFNLLRIVSRFIFIDGFFLDILLLLVLELYVTIRDIITLYEPLWWFVTSSIVIGSTKFVARLVRGVTWNLLWDSLWNLLEG